MPDMAGQNPSESA